jgi:hypothetical protein
MKKRANGHWNDFETLKEFLLPKCNELGRMLTTREVLEIKGLNHALKLHGGLVEVSKKLGFNTSSQLKTPSGNIVKSTYEVILDNFLYLNDLDYEYEGKISDNYNYLFDFKVEGFYIEIWGLRNKEYNKTKLLKEAVYESENLSLIGLDRKLFKKSLQEINNELVSIFRSHGIMVNNSYDANVNKLLEFDSYDKNMILSEMRDECINRGFDKLPAQRWWIENSFKRHVIFIWNNKLSMSDISKELGFEIDVKPYNYWKDWNNVEMELITICESLGAFPTYKYLKENNMGALLRGIQNHHGGLVKASVKLGFQSSENEYIKKLKI